MLGIEGHAVPRPKDGCMQKLVFLFKHTSVDCHVLLERPSKHMCVFGPLLTDSEVCLV